MSETRCPHCGEIIEPENSVSALKKWCRENGHVILALDRVFENVAAEILGLNPGTLRNYRSRSTGWQEIPYYRAGKSGRVAYALSDLSEYLHRIE